MSGRMATEIKQGLEFVCGYSSSRGEVESKLTGLNFFVGGSQVCSFLQRNGKRERQNNTSGTWVKVIKSGDEKSNSI